MRPKQIVVLIILVIMLIILFQNLDIIQIQILLWNIDISLLLVLLLPFILGIVAGWLLKSSLVKRKTAAEKIPNQNP